METVQFLADIDSEKLYAKKLELAYNCAYQEVLKIVIDLNQPSGHVLLDEQERCIGWHSSPNVLFQQLQQMRVVMALQIRQMAERRRRLADAAVGLPDRVLDEQSAQGEPRSDADRRD